MCGDTLKVLFVASKAEAFSFTKNRKAFSSLQMVWCEHSARNVLLCHLQKLWLLQIYIYFVWYLQKSKVLPCQKWCLCTVKGGSWESYTAQVVPDTVPYSPSLSSRAALWQSLELHQPCERREKTLLVAVPQHSLLPTRVVPHVPEGASSALIPVGGTACAYFYAAIILAARLDQALQQLEHPMLLMCTGAFSSTWVI